MTGLAACKGTKEALVGPLKTTDIETATPVCLETEAKIVSSSVGPEGASPGRDALQDQFLRSHSLKLRTNGTTAKTAHVSKGGNLPLKEGLEGKKGLGSEMELVGVKQDSGGHRVLSKATGSSVVGAPLHECIEPPSGTGVATRFEATTTKPSELPAATAAEGQEPDSKCQVKAGAGAVRSHELQAQAPHVPEPLTISPPNLVISTAEAPISSQHGARDTSNLDQQLLESGELLKEGAVEILSKLLSLGPKRLSDDMEVDQLLQAVAGVVLDALQQEEEQLQLHWLASKIKVAVGPLVDKWLAADGGYESRQAPAREDSLTAGADTPQQADEKWAGAETPTLDALYFETTARRNYSGQESWAAVKQTDQAVPAEATPSPKFDRSGFAQQRRRSSTGQFLRMPGGKSQLLLEAGPVEEIKPGSSQQRKRKPAGRKRRKMAGRRRKDRSLAALTQGSDNLLEEEAKASGTGVKDAVEVAGSVTDAVPRKKQRGRASKTANEQDQPLTVAPVYIECKVRLCKEQATRDWVDGEPTHCEAHATASEAVACSIPGCQNLATSTAGKTLCQEHAEPATDLPKLCEIEGCDLEASWGPEVGTPKRCQEHAESKWAAVRCSETSCRQFATTCWQRGKPTRCTKHAVAGQWEETPKKAKARSIFKESKPKGAKESSPKHGRPKKDETDADVSTPAKKQRGRKRKVEDATTADAQAEEVADEAKPKKGRKRNRLSENLIPELPLERPVRVKKVPKRLETADLPASFTTSPSAVPPGGNLLFAPGENLLESLQQRLAAIQPKVRPMIGNEEMALVPCISAVPSEEVPESAECHDGDTKQGGRKKRGRPKGVRGLAKVPVVKQAKVEPDEAASSPRTRKLTEAMQTYMEQKNSSGVFKEFDLRNIPPLALVGRNCKVYWPMDKEWYSGLISDYDKFKNKHKVVYDDNENEWLTLAQEVIKIQVFPGDGLESPANPGYVAQDEENEGKKPASSSREGVEAMEVAWGRVKGHPWWPALVLSEETAGALGRGAGPRDAGTVLIAYFGTYEFGRLREEILQPFKDGLDWGWHKGCKKPQFDLALEEAARFLSEKELPDKMQKYLDLAEAPNVSAEETEEGGTADITMQEAEGSLKQEAIEFPWQVENGLVIHTLGSIVTDSEAFHSAKIIWPLGFKATRKWFSTKDPTRYVDYTVEVLRDPKRRKKMIVRITPADAEAVEHEESVRAWEIIRDRVGARKAQLGLGKRPYVTSGPRLCGVSNKLVMQQIQGLPNARSACPKFNWTGHPLPETASVVNTQKPSSFLAPSPAVQPLKKTVDHSSKHRDRCHVCNIVQEYTDNQMLQCDKCRVMVHMECYGVLEPNAGQEWLCAVCEHQGNSSKVPQCCLCPVTGGAMKRTVDGRWAHVACAMWIPETCFGNIVKMEPIGGLTAILKDRWKLKCSICKIQYGACIQCVTDKCCVAYHPLCARYNGYAMEAVDADEAPQVRNRGGKFRPSANIPPLESLLASSPQKTSDRRDSLTGHVALVSWCPRHRPRGDELNDKQAVEGWSGEDDEVPKGDSAKEYVPPANASGAARTEPFNADIRRGRREPEAVAAALAKRLFVEKLPHENTYRVTYKPRPAGSQGGRDILMEYRAGKKHKDASAKSQSEEIMSISDRYRSMKSTMGERLLFGKSAIHGWGVFARKAHKANDMVIEYAGELVRPSIADMRERRCYDSIVGAGTYMFRIDHERVVDATHKGTIAHLINHACEPNCYSRVITACEAERIIIFAKKDISEGEELTYDYRFHSNDERLACNCGCPGCRGSVNIDTDGDDDDDDLGRVLAPRAEVTCKEDPTGAWARASFAQDH